MFWLIRDYNAAFKAKLKHFTWRMMPYFRLNEETTEKKTCFSTHIAMYLYQNLLLYQYNQSC